MVYNPDWIFDMIFAGFVDLLIFFNVSLQVRKGYHSKAPRHTVDAPARFLTRQGKAPGLR